MEVMLTSLFFSADARELELLDLRARLSNSLC